VIADSLGGVSNAYNITPQESTLNRHGDQAYMEKVIREANGCGPFFATITYPNTSTQIPSMYRYEYQLGARKVVDEFKNVNPDKYNQELGITDSIETSSEQMPSEAEEADLIAKIDTNGNGKVSIAEAKAAGYKMPIYSTHWLYKYMTDADGNGIVGE